MLFKVKIMGPFAVQLLLSLTLRGLKFVIFVFLIWAHRLSDEFILILSDEFILILMNLILSPFEPYSTTCTNGHGPPIKKKS